MDIEQKHWVPVKVMNDVQSEGGGASESNRDREKKEERNFKSLRCTLVI